MDELAAFSPRAPVLERIPPRREPGYDSTAPAAISRRPSTTKDGAFRGLIAALSLAGLAIIGVVWRTTDDASTENEAAAAPQPIVQSASEARPAAAVAPKHDPVRSEPFVPVVEPAPGASTASDNTEATTASNATDTAGREAARSPLAGTRASRADTSTEVARRDERPQHTANNERPGNRASTEPRVFGARVVPAVGHDAAKASTSNAATEALTNSKPSATPRPSIDTAQVRQALASAAAQARTCGGPGQASGSGSVRVLLDPSGGVLNATVTTALFHGTAVGRCVENAFRSAKTAPFDGRSLSTHYGFSVSTE
jgi:hypothetical protein